MAGNNSQQRKYKQSINTWKTIQHCKEQVWRDSPCFLEDEALGPEFPWNWNLGYLLYWLFIFWLGWVIVASWAFSSCGRLDGITDPMAMNLSKLQEMVKGSAGEDSWESLGQQGDYTSQS